MFTTFKRHRERKAALRKIELYGPLMEAAFHAGFTDGYTAHRDGVTFEQKQGQSQLKYAELLIFLKEDA